MIRRKGAGAAAGTLLALTLGLALGLAQGGRRASVWPDAPRLPWAAAPQPVQARAPQPGKDGSAQAEPGGSQSAKGGGSQAGPGGSPQVGPQAAPTAAPLQAYGIPAAVSAVILDNSRYPDGSTPAGRGQTPATFTLADVERLAVFSLAERTADGASRPSAAVADWVAGLTGGAAGYDVSNGVYAQTAPGAAERALAEGALVFDGHTASQRYQPPFNMMMLVAASAKAAHTVDLTGITSRVAGSALAQRLLCLFHTPRLAALETLLLGSDQLGRLDCDQIERTLLSATAAQRIATLDLSANGITQVAWNKRFAALAHVTALNLAGNAVATISSSLNQMLATVMANAGAADLGGASLNVADWNTVQAAVSLVNMATGHLALSNVSVGALVTATASAHGGLPQLNDRAVTGFLPQLDAAAIQSLLTHNRVISTAVREALGNRLAALQHPGGALAVGGRLDFGVLRLGAPEAAVVATGGLQVTATLPPGASLSVALSAWQNARGDRFTAPLLLPATADWPRTALGAAPVVLVANRGRGARTVSQAVTGVVLQAPAWPAVHRAASYRATVTWRIDHGVGERAD
ncbi:hypothetical protein [Lacticaseibacillus kribbianus]|uniref:hypothetical protein n=1 Tax=Lacticaseibacillus kribbianus TaxID=2926292 RepID=UPI001CD781ED|nr:hypothetical protein [Lacticaseibacillus kribbianus]